MSTTEAANGQQTPDTSPDLRPLLERASNARLVLIGAAGHGNHEDLQWRADLTRQLIAEHGFTFVATDADGPDARRVNAAVAGDIDTDPGDILTGLTGWPSWPLANDEIIEFCRWLREHNETLPAKRRVGWYGLQAHPLHGSVRTIVEYLREHQPDYVDTALDDVYTRQLVPDDHIDAVTELLARTHERPEHTGTPIYDIQDSKLSAGAHGYYRALLAGGKLAWNTRAAHMAATLEDLEEIHGPNSKGIVWAHNTHIGDARATDMPDRGLHNLGDFVRSRHGEDHVYTVGFAGGTGQTLAAPAHGQAMRVIEVREPKPGSLEAHLGQLAQNPELFFLHDAAWADKWRDQRAIGVSYDPGNEHWVLTKPSQRYDALCWFPTTTAAHAVHLDEASQLPTLR